MFNMLTSSVVNSLRSLKECTLSEQYISAAGLREMAQSLQNGQVPEQFMFNALDNRDINAWIKGECLSFEIEMLVDMGN